MKGICNILACKKSWRSWLIFHVNVTCNASQTLRYSQRVHPREPFLNSEVIILVFILNAKIWDFTLLLFLFCESVFSAKVESSTDFLYYNPGL